MRMSAISMSTAILSVRWLGCKPFGGEGNRHWPKAGGPLLFVSAQQQQQISLGGNVVYERKAPAAFEALLVWLKANGHAAICRFG